jgi:CMP-N,N'-diacetyllegionaminic acid synthase
MIDGRRVLAVVPARAGSKGLPAKNLRMLAGKPLVAWPVCAARASTLVDRVIVSTDDAAIAAAASTHGADVPFLRPAELASDTASSMQVIRHALEALANDADKYDYVVMLEPTSPMTRGIDIDQALQRLSKQRADADAIVGISRVEAAHPEYDVLIDSLGLIRPYAAADFSKLRRRQEIAELYFLEGSLYISDAQVFLSRGSFYHERTLGYEVPRWQSLEVDEEMDLVCIEALLTKMAALTH